jgi:hypothetical protein
MYEDAILTNDHRAHNATTVQTQAPRFIWSIWLVWFNQINKTNQINQINEIDRTDRMNQTG